VLAAVLLLTLTQSSPGHDFAASKARADLCIAEAVAQFEPSGDASDIIARGAIAACWRELDAMAGAYAIAMGGAVSSDQALKERVLPMEDDVALETALRARASKRLSRPRT
jgi:hypothetical protein